MSLSFSFLYLLLRDLSAFSSFITNWQVQINKHVSNWRLARGNLKSIGGSNLKHKSFRAPRWVLLQTSA